MRHVLDNSYKVLTVNVINGPAGRAEYYALTMEMMWVLYYNRTALSFHIRWSFN